LPEARSSSLKSLALRLVGILPLKTIEETFIIAVHLATAEENLNTLYFYNYFRGRSPQYPGTIGTKER
jgi:hypothetical protein